jgi:phosphoribosylaminoimidazolecarboxamide formyltransferase/IMP cyclohydrolase
MNIHLWHSAIDCQETTFFRGGKILPKAILSVYDKTGLVAFASGLIDQGWTLIASGGTADLLRQNHIEVTGVAEYTGSPEILGGRVKTLHPAIHGGLLARPSEADRAELLNLGWDAIDLVAVNLYPFEKTIAREEVTLQEAVENIDIGGATLIRAAAKNHTRVTLVIDPGDYAAVLQALEAGGVPNDMRQKLAIKGFSETARYDAAISAYFKSQFEETSRTPAGLHLDLYPVSELRYGENPHQQAVLYGYERGAGPLGGELLQGKALSYNNLLDLDAAWRAAISFERPTICIVKHLSPCGLASADTLAQAFPAALASDPVSAFGSVIAANRSFDAATARALENLFVECILAPGFDHAALEILQGRKNLRLIRMPDNSLQPLFELRSINQGVLWQTVDQGDPPETEWQVVSQRPPDEREWQALRFAWKACQHVKSNAIVFAKGEATVGIGGGQPNRVDCVRIAAQRAGEQSAGAVMASDAFFPFPDSLEAAAQVGITAVVSPGGSIRDQEAIAAADNHSMAMVFTGTRHFRH